MTLFSYVIGALMAFLAAKTIRKYREGHLTTVETMFWTGIWAVTAIIAFIPRVTTHVANLVGVGRGSDLIIYLAILGLFYICFRLYSKIETLEHELTLLVRELAIENGSDDD